MTEPLLTYGLSAGILKNILDVKNGLACECVCPKCKTPLVARNNIGNKKAPHFAHTSEKNCVGAYETALHLLAKEVLSESKKIRTPNFHHDYNNHNWESHFQEGKKIKFEKVSIEQSISNNGENLIIADAVGHVKSKQVIIEFAKTHFIDSEKTNKLLALNLACIEINLSNQILDKNILKKFLLSESAEIYWISNPRLDTEYKNSQEKLAAIEEKQRLISEAEYSIKINEIAIESRKNYEKYKIEGRYKFFRVYRGIANKCPKITRGLNGLKITRFYQHNILKRIIDGEYWNGVIYGDFGRDCYIFLQKERIIIFPNDSIRRNWSENEERSAKFFYAGLKELEKVIVDEGVCNFCSFQIDWLAFDNKELTVCSEHYGERTTTIPLADEN